MKLLRLILIVAVIQSTGCMKLKETLTLNSDGSGLIDIDYSISEETVTQIMGMTKLAEQLADASGEQAPYDSHDYLGLLLNPSEARIRQKVKDYGITGLTLEKVKVESRDGSRDVELQLAFKRITDLAKTDFFAEQGFALTRLQDGNYRLARRGSPTPKTAKIDMDDPKLVRMLTPVLGGFEANISIKTPGRLLEANTTRRTLKKAIWSFDFNRDAKAFRDFYNKDLVAIFDGDGLSLPAE